MTNLTISLKIVLENRQAVSVCVCGGGGGGVVCFIAMQGYSHVSGILI